MTSRSPAYTHAPATCTVKKYIASPPLYTPAMRHELTVYPTSRCPLRCNQCIMRHLMDAHPHYQMPLDTLEDLLLTAEQSHYHFHYILSGGEPLLWNHFQEGVRLIAQSKSAESLTLFTNATDISRLDPDTARHIDHIRVSRYDNLRNLRNTERLLELLPDKTRVVDRLAFWVNPDQPLGLHKPVACLNERQYLFMKRRVYACPHSASISLGMRRDDSDLYVPLRPGFLDLLEPVRQRQQHEICSRCISNKTVRLLSPTQPSRRDAQSHNADPRRRIRL